MNDEHDSPILEFASSAECAAWLSHNHPISVTKKLETRGQRIEKYVAMSNEWKTMHT